MKKERKVIIAGNWKMNKTVAGALHLCASWMWTMRWWAADRLAPGVLRR